MKNRLEQKLDAEFKRISDVEPFVHHFTNIPRFSAITIVSFHSSRSEIREIVDTMQEAMEGSEGMQRILNIQIIEPATHSIRILEEMGIYGMAICDKRDTFNRQRDRIIAKGRLLKHLKEANK